MLFQSANLLDHLTVAENVAVAQRLGRRPAPPDRARLLRDLGLADRANARPSQLSGGESARAGLAVAMANGPAVLLADEPSGEVDGGCDRHAQRGSGSCRRSNRPAARRPSRVMTAAPLVHTDGLARTYGHGNAAVVAVHGATCEIFAKQMVALTGVSGSGKSTLLHLLAGLDTPTAGTITWPAIGGRDELRPGPVAVVFQGPSLLPPLDVVENVALPLLLAGAAEATARREAREALELLGLSALTAKLPEELSGGQAQRVAIARALAGRPRLILADEPTGQLDHATAAGVIDALLFAAARLGAGLVISTHDPQVADRLPDHWMMEDGRLVTRTENAAPCSA
jgi:ABC-type lipoprotein export system ATPase subunit